MSKKINDVDILDKNLEFKSLDYIISERFSRYSKYIILHRAIPDLRDGLKPVQRRILYSMYDLNLKYDKPFKKSARVVGDVIGKYHPHGDSSIYDALVRMAQDWKMNVPLVEMHGNKGSIDDDPAAAMRYTEARLSKISEEMLVELDKKIVPFAPNFDDSEKEPVYLPSYIPNLLVNGAKGIASGYAVEVPPHNLGEIFDATIAKIKKPELSLNSLKRYIKGPDFPTGGIVYSKKGIDESFERGSGRIVIVSKYKIIENNKTKKIVITEIPYGVVKSKLVKQIDDLRVDSTLSGIIEVLDESDREGIAISIELDKNANHEAIISYLFKKTEMQVYYSYNMVVIHENSPKLLGTSKIIDNYINFIRNIKIKSIKFDLEKSKLRLEIIEGFVKVSKIIDEVIKVIRNTEESKQGVILNLQNKLGFSENQAKAIAEMRLYRLNKTDVSIYLKDKEKLLENIKLWENILNDSNLLDEHLIQIIKNLKKEYATPRKTEIIEEEFNVNVKLEEVIESKKINLCLTKDGYLKILSPKILKSNNFSSYFLKDGDEIIFFEEDCDNKDKLLVFLDSGKYLFIPLHKVKESKWKDFGVHINEFANIESNEKIIRAILVRDFETKAYVVSITKYGMGKKTIISNFLTSRYSKTNTYMKFKKANDKVVDIKISNGYEDILIFNSINGVIRHSSQIMVPNISIKSMGNSLIKLKDDFVASFVLYNKGENILCLNKKFKIKEFDPKNITLSNKSKSPHIFFNSNQNKNIILDSSVSSKTSFIFKDKSDEIKLEKFLSNSNLNFEDSFSVVKQGIKWINILSSTIVKNTNYFNVEIPAKEEEENIIEEADLKIDKTFKEVEKEVDIEKINDILKKFKI